MTFPQSPRVFSAGSENEQGLGTVLAGPTVSLVSAFNFEFFITNDDDDDNHHQSCFTGCDAKHLTAPIS